MRNQSVGGPVVGLGELLWDLLPAGPRAGGAPYNFAFHVAQLGHPAALVSRVGGDERGRALAALLPPGDHVVQTDPERPTGVVHVKLAAGQPTYEIQEHVAWDGLAWDATLADLAGRCSAVCFGTLAQRAEPSRSTVRRFATAARAAGALTVFDINLRQRFYDRETVDWSLAHADWVKLNGDELAALAAFYAWPDAEGERLDALRQAGPAVAILTRGADGCRVVADDADVDEPGFPVTATDAVGAGDAFAAGLLVRRREGGAWADAARFACAFASLVATRPGGTPQATRDEVDAVLNGGRPA